MGAQLVAQALARWAPHISDRAFRVLIRMAVTALDNDNGTQTAGMYFGGADLLAMTLRSQGTDESARRLVRYALTELEAVGAIEVIAKPTRWKAGKYRLTLDNDPMIAGTLVPDRRNTGSGDSKINGTQTHDRRNAAFRYIERNQEEPTQDEERSEEEGVASTTELTTARADEPTTPEEDQQGREEPAEPRGAVGACGHYLDPDGTCFVCQLGNIDHRAETT